ncbi:HEAT/U-box domain-containing protein [Tasmannia lanceolata]|uniref:HEAT/U-box domain-containing protein n=1 Tax=Tasmannia lanceolata TaxID=3420 RepID=UPI004063BE83
MGREKGADANRSKTRPSSSSLAASLLPSGASSVGFGGYVGSSRLASDDAAVPGAPFQDVDGEVSQHLKRLGRKDPTTKLKSLTSLCALFKERSGEEVVQIIPQWVFEYKRLLLDYNREVRRATHEAMTNLVSSVGRGLALHLKSLMGPWWFSQFDPISEVSQAARLSLQAAFPAPERRRDALILCVSEIFLYLNENLKLTPQAITDKAAPLDELEDIRQRVISSSLLALATLIDILLGIQLQKQDSENVITELKNASKARQTAISSAEMMFSTHKYFLEFLKSQNPRVRSAAYSVLGSFIRHIPHAFNEENLKMLSAQILGAFHEKDPTCHSSMWDMILLFSKKFPESWSLGNIQKIVLARFWHFLRNGCYGSQQVSYPILLIFIDSMPPKSIEGEQFFLNFFQNLWAGRNPSHCSSADRLAFFKAFKECFIWAIYNASRYFVGENAVNQFQVGLVDHVLVMLLWRDFLLLISPEDQDELLSGKRSLEDYTRNVHRKPMETMNVKYPINYIQDLGRCIIEILSDISSKECNLLSAFCTPFQNYCLGMFQRTECFEEHSEHAEQIVKFLLLLEQHAVKKGETWPLIYLAGPMVEKTFPLIKSVDSPDGVRILTVLVEIFGPRTVLSEFLDNNKGHSNSNFSDEGSDESKLNYFFQVFEGDFVPWCLHGKCRSTSYQLDLLLALLDDDLFSKQWCSIVTYATKSEEIPGTGVGHFDFDRIAMLAMLIEKIRGRTDSKKVIFYSNHLKPSHPEHWHHELLNSAALSVARLSPPFHSSQVRFLRAVLGGSSEDERSSFVSRETMILVFEEVLTNFVPLLMESSFTWAKCASSLIQRNDAKHLAQKHELSFINKLEMAQFAFQILEGSFFSLKILDGDCELVPCILSAIFIIDWECNMASEIDGSPKNDVRSSLSTCGNVIDGDLPKPVDAKLTFGESMDAFRGKISIHFWRSLSLYTVQRLRNILVQTVRLALFKTETFHTDKIPALCCRWVLDVLEISCRDHYEEQSMLDQLLSEGESWPLWVAPLVTDGKRSATLKDGHKFLESQASRHHQVVAFVNKLISSIGGSRVITGSLQTLSSSSTVEAPDEEAPLLTSYSRAWLAAEILCTWKWQGGGSALGSLLPFLGEYAKKENFSPEESLIFSIVKILLDGALDYGSSSESNFFNLWAASDDEVENIQNPFLRALLSFLSTLMVNNSIWGKDEAVAIFEHVANKLFIGTTVNIHCLRILPFVLNVLIQPLRNKTTSAVETNKEIPVDSLREDQIQETILAWLRRTLSSPPLISWQTEQHELEGWIQVALSCYPLTTKGGIGTLKMALSIDISELEKTLLMDLFRKQRCVVNSPNTAKQIALQMMLPKLTAITVGYCWQQFSEDDWDFVLSQLHRWTESTVVPMEEMAESVDDIVTNTLPSDNLDVIVEKLEQAVRLDPSLMIISRTALFILSLFLGLSELQQAENTEFFHSLIMGKWDHIKDRILEGVLRLFFATGVAESIASSYCEEASSIVASTRLPHFHFWELVASNVINSPQHVRNTAVHSVELWGLSRGPISSLYALLFSARPISSLQVAAFIILSTEPVQHMGITKGDTRHCLDGDVNDNQEAEHSRSVESSLEKHVHLRDEISFMIEKSPSELLEMDLVAQNRVNVFIAWALLLTYLQSQPSTSQARERLVQYIQDSVSSAILDCIFEHIPLKLGSTPNLKKKEVELPAEASKAATSAKCAITTSSLLFAVESLWPVGNEEIATMAGAIFGLMLRLLPAFVRNWFAGLRDRSTSSAIESFMKVWCSPSLLLEELSQVKGAVVADENFSVSVNKSPHEITATYKKEETGMDLVIRLPSCYPLLPVDVDCTKSLGISEVKQRKWLLSMTAIIRNQNGAIAEAINIWKSNLDKEFEGVEECPICYSIIHTNDHSLPRLACKTCKHKFHARCLYKWFKTSPKATCPLCQTPF